MDVMKPKLVWVEGRCYRFFESDAWSEKDHASTPYIEDSNPQEFSDLNEETCPPEIDVVSIEGGKYKHSFYVPSTFFRFIIGQNGVMHKRLENDTRTTIKIPKMGKDGDIVIIGPSRTSVLSARHRIDLLVETSRKKLKPTHFLSIPMNDTKIKLNFNEFKKIVVNETSKNAHGIQEGIFQKPEKMHLTLGMLILADNEEVKAAIDALEECKRDIITPFLEDTGPIKIKAQGLECMNDDPSEVSVVYGKILTDGDALQLLADLITNFFINKGLMRKEHDKVNLHMTVMNASFMIDKESTNYQKAEKFDASNILKMHKDHFFGETALSTIQICRRGQNAPDGYYTITSKIDLQ